MCATSFAGTEIARRKAWGGRDDLRVVGEELGLQIAVHGIGAGQDLADPTAELRAALHSILGTPARDVPDAQNAPARGELLTEGA